MSEEAQEKAGVKIGLDYPAPIVDEQIERNKGIQACYAARKDGDVKTRSKSLRHSRVEKKRNQRERFDEKR